MLGKLAVGEIAVGEVVTGEIVLGKCACTNWIKVDPVHEMNSDIVNNKFDF